MTQRRTASPMARIAAPICLGLIALVIWRLLSLTMPATLLPPPAAVAARWASEVSAGMLLSATGATLVEALCGCLLAVVVALPVGVLIARSRLAEWSLAPYLAASQAIPAVAVAPLLVIWVGYGLLPITLLCALLVFFPVVLATTLGVRQVDRELVEAAQLDGATSAQILFQIEEPLARRTVLTGIRNGFTLSITGAVVGELVMGGNGLGMLLSVQSSSVDTTGLFATLATLAVLAIAIYLILLVAEIAGDPLRAGELQRRSETR